MPAKTAVLASVIAFAALVGCGNDDDQASAPITTLPATTSTTRSADALRAALLSPADVPGAKASTPSPDDLDLSACFPGNPLGAKTDPGEIDSPDLELTQGAVERSYSSSARQATQEQAAAFVATFLSPAGSECVLNAIKVEIAGGRTDSQIDLSGLKGSASKAAVGDAGGTLAVRGLLRSGARSAGAEADLLVFHKGPVVVLLLAGAINGPVVPNQAVELGQKIAGRL